MIRDLSAGKPMLQQQPGHIHYLFPDEYILSTQLQFQFHNGVPEIFLKINDHIIHDFYFFLFEQGLHPGWGTEMHFTGEHTVPVYDSVRGYGIIAVCGIHGPANYTGAHFGAQESGNGPIGSNPAFRYHPGYLMHLFKKRVRFFFAAG